jgi:hypothetical protein
MVVGRKKELSMATYEAWIPVTVLVRAQLDLDDEEDLSEYTADEVVQMFRSDAESMGTLCDDCSDNIRMDEGSLECDEISSSDVKVTKLN